MVDPDPDDWRKPSLEVLGPDLLRVTSRERAMSLALPWILVALFFWTGSRGWWPLTILSAMAHSFFTYGSVSHDLVHRTLRLPAWLNETLLFAIEASGFRSGHAYRFTHLHHHQTFPDPDDVEARAARYGWLGALLDGVVAQPRLWLWAVRRASGPQRGWIAAEGLTVLLLAGVCLGSIPWTRLPAAYLILMLLGSWIFPLVTVFLPHDAAGRTALTQTRLFRGRILSWLAFDHLYHLEHHMYPQVPHQRWAELARRLDPYLKAEDVKPFVLWR